MKYKYWFDCFSGLSNKKKISFTNLGFAAEDVFFMERDKIKELNILTEEEIGKFIIRRNRANPERDWVNFLLKNINFTCIENDNYPSKLKYITNPPYALYYLGELPDDNKRSIAIVGARGRSAYGSAVADKLAKTLASMGVQIISGLALGIDADAHKGALLAGGKTYGVLGCGVDVCYPRSNRFLYDKIIENGGVISEFSPGTQAQTTFFPRRNRIISGLSDAVVVVEAREKSGSLITADFAMEQGKDVFAVPGRITDELSGGCNRLIKQGAGVILTPEDLLSELDFLSDNNCVQLDFMKKLLEKDESLVYSLFDFRPMNIGALLEETALDINELISVLHRLEEKGYIKELLPNHYVKTI